MAAAAPAPLTGVGWAHGAEAVPPGWTAITVTAEGAPACLGKGFGHRTGWYLCFSRAQEQAGPVPLVTDVLVLSERSPQPPGYSRAPHFPESRAGSVSRRKALLLRREAAAAVAVLELHLSLGDSAGPQLSRVGEMGGFSIWCRKGPVSPEPPSAGLERLSLRPPRPPPPLSGPKSTPDPSGIRSAMDGIPFALHPKFEPGLSSPIPAELPLKSLAEIEREYSYEFLLERTAASRLPPGLE